MTLELIDITRKVGGETHIHPTSLTLERGGFTVLLGTTLAGKTTLMQLMAGLERPTSGRIRFDGADVTGVSVQRRKVALVHQQFINYPSLTVYENIASPLRVARMDRAEIDARVRATAEMLRLAPMLARRPEELSGGQQQRTALARALVKDADLVLLDEPLANLDYKLREELREELPRLFAGRGSVVVYATTEPSEALLLGGRTATLHEGRITGFGASSALYRNPGDLLTARVFSEPPINTAPVDKRAGRFVLPGGADWDVPPALSGLPDGRYTVAIRPHGVVPEGAGHGAGPLISGRILVAELSGSETVAHFDMNGLPWVAQAHGIHAAEPGTLARFRLDPAQCLYFGVDGHRLAG